MTRGGRPLRFLCLVIGAWTTVRVALLWPAVDSVPALADAIVPGALASTPSLPPVARTRPYAFRIPIPPPSPRRLAFLASRTVTVAPARNASRAGEVSDPDRIALGAAAFYVYDTVEDVPGASAQPPGTPAPLPATPRATRWSGSAWVLARGGAGLAPGVVAGSLGGSQAGVRLAYRLDDRGRLAVAGRLTSPLGSGLREAALGVEWQPTSAPVRAVVEYRQPLGRGRGGPAAGIVGGFGPRVAGPVQIEGYGQAGVVRRGGAEPYVDGAVRAARPVARSGPVRFDVGAGIWGAAQRGAARLDVGPGVSAAVPIARQPVRMSLDWRQRIAGTARPGSGLAFTLGADF